MGSVTRPGRAGLNTTNRPAVESDAVGFDEFWVPVRNRNTTQHRVVYRIPCPMCSKVRRVRQDKIGRVMLFCQACMWQNNHPPFYSLHKKVAKRAAALGLAVMTYEEFIAFTKEQHCHYCGEELRWEPYGISKYRCFNLDRKDNDKGYEAENCVPCCRFCNMVKRDWFTYEEFMFLAPGLRKVREMRKGGTEHH